MSPSILVDRVLGVPLDSTGRFEGCQLLPGALRQAGLFAGASIDAGNLQVTLAEPRRHPDTNITASDDLLAASHVIADATHELAQRGLRPLLVGGDCSMLLGVMNGLRRHDPEVGLITLDGHFDMHTPATSETGDAADMEITLLTDAASPFSSLDKTTPPLAWNRVAFIGPRDHDEMTNLGSPLPHDLRPAPYIADLPALTEMSIVSAAAGAAQYLRDTGATGFWLHVDLDVLTTADMPAVDYPQPRGLTWAQLHEATRLLVLDQDFCGLSIAVLNPSLDSDGTAVAATVEWLHTVLAAT